MRGSVYFLQRCTACGRMMQVKVRYLGSSVRCQHCSVPILAADPSAVPADCSGLPQRTDVHEVPGRQSHS